AWYFTSQKQEGKILRKNRSNLTFQTISSDFTRLVASDGTRRKDLKPKGKGRTRTKGGTRSVNGAVCAIIGHYDASDDLSLTFRTRAVSAPQLVHFLGQVASTEFCGYVQQYVPPPTDKHTEVKATWTSGLVSVERRVAKQSTSDCRSDPMIRTAGFGSYLPHSDLVPPVGHHVPAHLHSTLLRVARHVERHVREQFLSGRPLIRVWREDEGPQCDVLVEPGMAPTVSLGDYRPVHPYTPVDEATQELIPVPPTHMQTIANSICVQKLICHLSPMSGMGQYCLSYASALDMSCSMVETAKGLVYAPFSASIDRAQHIFMQSLILHHPDLIDPSSSLSLCPTLLPYVDPYTAHPHPKGHPQGQRGVGGGVEREEEPEMVWEGSVDVQCPRCGNPVPHVADMAPCSVKMLIYEALLEIHAKTPQLFSVPQDYREYPLVFSCLLEEMKVTIGAKQSRIIDSHLETVDWSSLTLIRFDGTPLSLIPLALRRKWPGRGWDMFLRDIGDPNWLYTEVAVCSSCWGTIKSDMEGRERERERAEAQRFYGTAPPPAEILDHLGESDGDWGEGEGEREGEAEENDYMDFEGLAEYE
ncbi:hypothetical protein KIPB_007632, partial [Kipferlia bialata]